MLLCSCELAVTFLCASPLISITYYCPLVCFVFCRCQPCWSFLYNIINPCMLTVCKSPISNCNCSRTNLFVVWILCRTQYIWCQEWDHSEHGDQIYDQAWGAVECAHLQDGPAERAVAAADKTTECVDGVVHRLDETDKAIAGDLDSVKSTVHGRLDDVESSFAHLKAAQEELGDRFSKLSCEMNCFTSWLRVWRAPCDPQLHPSFLQRKVFWEMVELLQVRVLALKWTVLDGINLLLEAGKVAATDATTEERGSISTRGEVL